MLLRFIYLARISRRVPVLVTLASIVLSNMHQALTLTLWTSLNQVLVTIVRDGSSAFNLKVVLGDEAAGAGGGKRGQGFLPPP